MYGFAGLDGARIVGIHQTKQARGMEGTSTFELAMDAVEGALADAGMELSDVDGLSSGLFHWPLGPADMGGIAPSQPPFWAYQLGIQLRWFHAAPPGMTAVLDCAAAIVTGRCSTVVMVTARHAGSGPIGHSIVRPENEFSGFTGSFTAAQYALVARRLLHERGETKWLLAMAEAAATIRNYGHRNPGALYFERGPFSAEDVLDSQMIADPLTLLMCTTVNDGASAIVLTTKERAQDAPRRAVKILGGASSFVYSPYVEAPVLDWVPDDSGFAREAFKRMGISPADVDVLELYDHFAPSVLLELEMYGFCRPGTAADFVLDGGLGLDGTYPTGTDGGNLSTNTGFPVIMRVIEGVRQVRGDVADLCPPGGHTGDSATCRLVKDANVFLAAGPGAPTNSGDFGIFMGD